MKKLTKLFLSFLFLSCAALSKAETIDFGGFAERYKGGGDKIPPNCQIEIPRAATSDFFIKWNCSDDNASSEEIRSELWLYKKDSPTGELVANFLGFPASVQITKGLLGVENFTDALPFSVKLLARDETGMTTISPQLFVQAQDNSVSSCTLQITKASTESDDSNTGIPETNVTLENVAVDFTQANASELNLSSSQKSPASPCEIDSICFDDSKVSFSSKLTFASSTSSTVTGTISIVPGSLVANINGEASISNLEIQSLEASGSTRIEGVAASITLSCSK